MIYEIGMAQKEMFISCPMGLETLLLEELQEMGISPSRRGKSGVYVPQEISLVYEINYRSHLATRVLWPLKRFACPDPKALYQGAKQIDWPLYLSPEKTFAIDANVSHPLLRSSLYAAQVVKDALCDSLKEKWGERPSVNVSSPDVQLNLFIEKGWAILSFDTSLQPLYKRGYRQQMTSAPLQETLAAAILRKIDYSKEEILCDPFCGSGTFLIEAAFKATRTPAGFFRKNWGFFQLPEFSEELWQKVKSRADGAIIPSTLGKFFGADIDPRTLEICKQHLKMSGFEQAIALTCSDVARYNPPSPPSVILCNPPYGKRLATSSKLAEALGLFIKKSRCRSAFVLTPETSNFIEQTRVAFRPCYSFLHGGSKVVLHALN
jgi:putative N6-adenine-specific DNA methylase